VSELIAGSADVIDTVPTVLEPQIENDPNLELLVEPFAGRRMLLFNTNSGPTADVALRQAVNYAINRDDIVKATGGEGYPLYGIWVDGELGYDEDDEPYEYDPEKAKEILTDAGLSGTSFTLTHQEGEETDEAIALVVQENMAAVGVTVNIESGPSSTMLTEFTSGQRAGAYVGNFAAIYPGEELLLSLHLTDTGSYGAAYGSPDVTTLATQLRSTVDPGERLKILDDIQDQAIDTEALWAPIMGYPLVYGVASGLDWTPRQGNKYNFEDATFTK
jgi:peptide/nickel transport system substrate-binding protein